MGTRKKLMIAAVAAMAGVAGARAALELSRRRESVSPTPFRGSHKSKTVHQPGCRYYDLRKLAEVFGSPAEAVEAGYSPCKLCLG